MQPNGPQRQCIEDTYGHPSALVAGAGSGKTATLTKRIAYALAHPEVSGVTDIDQVLAITYTTKAAGELRSRVKAELASQGMAEQALKVDGAWISTIHSMCARILRENAFTLGVDPAFVIASENQAAALLDQAAEAVLAGAWRDDKETASMRTADVVAFIDEYGRDQARGMLVELTSKAAETDTPLKDFFVPMPQGDDSYLATMVFYVLEARDMAAAGKSGKTIDKWMAGTEAALRDALALVSEPIDITEPCDLLKLRAVPLSDQLRAINAFPKPPRTVKVFKEGCIEATGEPVQDAYFSVANACRLAIGACHLRTLCALAGPTLRLFAAEKARLGLMDNNDLVVRASRLLRDPANASVCARYAKRFKLVMVDEFQDTNQMQVDMINLVAGGTDERQSDRMCVVGDAQQSIYRFRSADLDVFVDYVNRLRANYPKQCIQMGTNYRSHAEILAFCKGAFERGFGANYLDLLHGRDEARVDAATPFRGVRAQPSEENAADPRRVNVKAANFRTSRVKGLEATANSIADDFERLIQRGHQPGDMVILLGRMTNSALFADALQARDIPCAITGGSTFKNTPEAKLVLALADALVDLSDTHALAAVLTGGMFDLGAADFAWLVPEARTQRPRSGDALARKFVQVASRPASEPFMGRPDVPNGVACALDVLGWAARQVGSMPLSALVAEVMARSGWLSRMQGTAKEQAANAMKAVRIIADVEKTQLLCGRSLAQAARDSIENAKEAPGVLSAEGDNFVRIMTIHASKGLQFPIVAVADAFTPELRPRKLTAVSSGKRLYLALDAGEALSGFETSELVKGAWKSVGAAAKHVFGDKERALGELAVDEMGRPRSKDPATFTAALLGYDLLCEQEEHERLLYVAYTRARDCLIVTYPYNPKEVEEDQVTSQSCIEQLLCGRGRSYETQNQQGSWRELYPVHTRRQAPECALDWFVRFEMLNPEPEEDDAAQEEQDDPPAESGGLKLMPRFMPIEPGEPAPEKCPLPPLVPTRGLPTYTDAGSFGLNWSKGILSASALKARAHADSLEEVELPSLFAAMDADDDGCVVEPFASATEKGTAFHAAAECVVRAWRPGERFALPPAARIEAIARAHGLNAVQRDELEYHLQAWVESDLAAQLAARAHVKCEEPFWLQIAPSCAGGEPLVMQGFIDLLAYDCFGQGEALVVDYKTGCSLDTEEKRRSAYELQAKTYAHAVLTQGFESVRLAFVFVEQRDNEGKAPVVLFPAPSEAAYDRNSLRAELEDAARS